MSFSGIVKKELSEQIARTRSCQLSELSALLLFCGSLKNRKGQLSLILKTENEDVVRKYFTLLKKAYNIDTCALPDPGQEPAKTGIYEIEITKEQELTDILKGVKWMTPEGEILHMSDTVNPLLLQTTDMKRAFLRGAYLAGGSMSDPRKGYHLEYVCTTLPMAEQLQSVVRSFDIEAKIVERKRYQVLYIKEGESIVELLNVMEAHRALMDLENLRIEKEIRNSINRRVNCETANICKTANAASRQVADIELIQRVQGLDSLPGPLREMAQVRLEHPEEPLADLGNYLDPPVGKSGVNHRLRKLSEIAESLQ